VTATVATGQMMSMNCVWGLTVRAVITPTPGRCGNSIMTPGQNTHWMALMKISGASAVMTSRPRRVSVCQLPVPPVTVQTMRMTGSLAVFVGAAIVQSRSIQWKSGSEPGHVAQHILAPLCKKVA